MKKAHLTIKGIVKEKYTGFTAHRQSFTDATFVKDMNTRAFRSTSFRQGAAVTYEELQKKPDHVAGEEKKGEDEEDKDIRGPLLKHFKQHLKQDLVRTFKISAVKSID